ncbi:unnamed protein product [Leptosia nina]|uniref:Uncharacterized protein n=1 Tax=Leptosia nina TaxID=320188 RepID=A0AAV1K0H7_9NEOP
MLGRTQRQLIQIPTTAFNRNNVHTVTEFTGGLTATLSAAGGLHLGRRAPLPGELSRRELLLEFVVGARRYDRVERRSAALHVPFARRSADEWRPAGDGDARAGASRMRAPRTPARSHNGKRLGAHVISESESVTHFPAIQVYVSARSRGCATARAGSGAGGGPLTQLRTVAQQGRVAASDELMFTFAVALC